ncbi:MAG: hypothetical protein AAFW46_04630 [Pseudomonadota bacterium]
MKRTMPHVPTRPSSLARRKPRTRPEIAAELVRLEYERDRIERDLGMINQRRLKAERQLDVLAARVRLLNQMLQAADDRAAHSS